MEFFFNEAISSFKYKMTLSSAFNKFVNISFVIRL